MKYFIPLLILLCLGLNSCGKNPEDQKELLNGYWKIQNAKTPYKIDRDFKFSEMVDYIEVKNDTGFRAKVLPRFDGTAVTNEVRDQLILSIKDDSLRMNYKTPYDAWQETVLEVDEETLMIKNRRGFIYTYSRYEPINITE